MFKNSIRVNIHPQWVQIGRKKHRQNLYEWINNHHNLTQLIGSIPNKNIAINVRHCQGINSSTVAQIALNACEITQKQLRHLKINNRTWPLGYSKAPSTTLLIIAAILSSITTMLNLATANNRSLDDSFALQTHIHNLIYKQHKTRIPAQHHALLLSQHLLGISHTFHLKIQGSNISINGQINAKKAPLLSQYLDQNPYITTQEFEKQQNEIHYTISSH